ncbi:hypothetical protein L4C34_02720 [Vibrio profundum]|uniref:hypothetical protein n=1 Tax=Vibrio profundum TaxID=2910247 RepID=UPI003D0FDFBC
MNNEQLIQALGAQSFKPATKQKLIKNVTESVEKNNQAKQEYGNGVSVKGVLVNICPQYFLAKCNHAVESGKEWNASVCRQPTNHVSPLGTSGFFHVHASGAATGSRAGMTYKILDRNDIIQGYVAVAWENPWNHDLSNFVYCIKVSKSQDHLTECLNYCASNSVSKIEGDDTFGPSDVSLAQNIKVVVENETTSSIMIAMHTDVVVEQLLTRPIVTISHWMSDNWALVGNKTLSQLCIPGSHDTGTYVKTHRSATGSDRRTQTQRLNIQQQLENGVRFFDLRPALYEGGFYTHHSSDIPVLGRQGAIGAKLSDVFSQIRQFYSNQANHKELSILDFGHFLDWESGDGLSNDQKAAFVEQVQQELSDLLIGDVQSFNNTPLDGLVSNGQVIALFPNDCPNLDASKGTHRANVLNIQGSYSNTNELGDMVRDQKDKMVGYPHQGGRNIIFELYWTLTLSDTQNAIGGLDPTGGSSILSLAEEANAALISTISQWVDEGTLNVNYYPNIILLDDCSEDKTRAVAASLGVIRIINA